MRLTKRIVTILLISSMLFAFSTSVTIAEGDKERGDKATGFSCQVQEQDPPPFQQ